jgi:hypothetical protein
MPVFYGTFGVAHDYADSVQPIIAQDDDAARAKMFEAYGHEWCSTYAEEGFAAYVSRYYTGRGRAAPTELPVLVALPEDE